MTGGAGFIGSQFAQACLKLGHDLVWNRIKDALRVSSHVSLRFWRWSGKPRRSGVAAAEHFDEEAVQRLFRRIKDESREAECLSS